MTAPIRFPRFFVTSPAPCPYLPGKEERKVFTELKGAHADQLNEALGRIGFRRSQTVAYRPSCLDCQACVSVRVVAREFKPYALSAFLHRFYFRSEVFGLEFGPDQALYVSDALPHTARVMVKDEDLCVHCGLCAERCPTGAWDMQKYLYKTGVPERKPETADVA